MDSSFKAHWRDQFKTDVLILGQQMESRLWRFCDPEPDAITADYFFFNSVGTVSVRTKTAVGGPTPQMGPVRYRRRGAVVPYEWGDHYDIDQLRIMVENPQAKDKKLAVAAFNRKLDEVIIAAALGNVTTVASDRSESTSGLPAAQTLAVNYDGPNTNLTLAKLLEAKRLMDAAEIPGKRVCVLTSSQVKNLLNTTEVKSSDYNSVQALARGELNGGFLGFDEFIRTELVPVNGSGYRRVVCMIEGAIGGFKAGEPMVEMGKDPANSFIPKVYMQQPLGALRVEDKRIVEILCNEA